MEGGDPENRGGGLGSAIPAHCTDFWRVPAGRKPAGIFVDAGDLKGNDRLLPDIYQERDQKRTRDNGNHCLLVSLPVKHVRQSPDDRHDKRNNGNQLSHFKDLPSSCPIR